MGYTRSEALLALGPRDQRQVKTAINTLRRLPTRAAPAALFEAIRKTIPIMGGLIGQISESNEETMVNHAVALPKEVLEGWWSAPKDQIGLLLSPLFMAKPGQLISDTQTIIGEARETLALLSVLKSAGLGEAAGYKVAPIKDRGFLYMTFALEKGRTFTTKDRTILNTLRQDIHNALKRIALPIIPSQPIAAQIIEEQEKGYICVKQNNECLEWNERARALATKYQNAAHIEPGRDAFTRFIKATLNQWKTHQNIQLQHEKSTLTIVVHHLAKETHAIAEDLHLITLEEKTTKIKTPAQHPNWTKRQAEIAHLLITTGLSYQELADHLAIAEGTLRKHTENIYRAANVHSRPELVAKMT
jgi:DNA-binding CsgD family transcriptional regulator